MNRKKVRVEQLFVGIINMLVISPEKIKAHFVVCLVHIEIKPISCLRNQHKEWIVNRKNWIVNRTNDRARKHLFCRRDHLLIPMILSSRLSFRPRRLKNFTCFGKKKETNFTCVMSCTPTNLFLHVTIGHLLLPLTQKVVGWHLSSFIIFY